MWWVTGRLGDRSGKGTFYYVPFTGFDILNLGKVLLMEKVNLEKNPIKSVRRSKPINANNSHCHPQHRHHHYLRGFLPITELVYIHQVLRKLGPLSPDFLVSHCPTLSSQGTFRVLGESRWGNFNLTQVTRE